MKISVAGFGIALLTLLPANAADRGRIGLLGQVRGLTAVGENALPGDAVIQQSKPVAHHPHWHQQDQHGELRVIVALEKVQGLPFVQP